MFIQFHLYLKFQIHHKNCICMMIIITIIILILFIIIIVKLIYCKRIRLPHFR
jgi:hypothetical protein